MKIFISYRRDDSAGYAGRLFDYLSAHFGARSVFMDIDTIEPGEDFRKVVTEAVGTCDVVLVMIGKQWLSVSDSQGGRRLDDPRDWVRAEISAALADSRVRVIPVLVRDAFMPGEHELPDGLKDLAYRNAIELSDSRFQHDVRKLIGVIERIGVKPSNARPPGRPKLGPVGYWGAILGVLVLGLVLGLARFGMPTFVASETPTVEVVLPTRTPTLAPEPLPTNSPEPTLEPTPTPSAAADTMIRLIDGYYTCINTATRFHRDEFEACWDLLSDRPGEFQENLTANRGGKGAFIDFWNDFKVSYALYSCVEEGQYFVDAEYYLHYRDDLSRMAGGKNLLEYSFALGSDGWRIAGGVVPDSISPYCEPEPRVDKRSLFP